MAALIVARLAVSGLPPRADVARVAVTYTAPTQLRVHIARLDVSPAALVDMRIARDGVWVDVVAAKQAVNGSWQ